MFESLVESARSLMAQSTNLGGMLPMIKDTLLGFDLKEADLQTAESYYVLALALHAASLGNFGVGAAIFTAEGEMVCSAENAVFHPRFDSSAHAEMQAITLAEKEGLFTNPMSKYVLVTSLEPCPMCLARIALSQIGTVRYLSTDPTGGANSLQCALPADFQELLANQSIEQMADLPEPLGDLGYAISRESSKALNAKLAARG